MPLFGHYSEEHMQCLTRCSVGKIGDAVSGTCLDICGSSSMVTNGDCSIENVASNSQRDICTCNLCESGKLGDSCEYAGDQGDCSKALIYMSF